MIWKSSQAAGRPNQPKRKMHAQPKWGDLYYSVVLDRRLTSQPIAMNGARIYRENPSCGDEVRNSGRG